MKNKMQLQKTFVILLILLSVQGFSQVKPFRFGVKAAPNIAWLAPDSKGYEKGMSQPGFSWGFLADITLADNYFVKTGFNIDYMNSKLSFPYLFTTNSSGISTLISGTLDRKYKLRYLEIPLMIKMRTNTFGKTAFFGEIGFSGSLNLRAKSKDEFTPANSETVYSSEQDIKDEIAFVRASLIVGAGIEYFIDESTSLVFSVDFNNGLSNALKGDNKIDTEVKQRAQLYYFELNVGIMF